MPHETQGLFLYDYVLLCYFPFEQLSTYVCPTLYTGIHPIGPISLENPDEYTHLSVFLDQDTYSMRAGTLSYHCLTPLALDTFLLSDVSK